MFQITSYCRWYLLGELFFKAKRERAGQIVSTATMAAKAQLMEEAELNA